VKNTLIAVLLLSLLLVGFSACGRRVPDQWTQQNNQGGQVYQPDHSWLYYYMMYSLLDRQVQPTYHVYNPPPVYRAPVYTPRPVQPQTSSPSRSWFSSSPRPSTASPYRSGGGFSARPSKPSSGSYRSGGGFSAPRSSGGSSFRSSGGFSSRAKGSGS
jgi:hypothetical protein